MGIGWIYDNLIDLSNESGGDESSIIGWSTISPKIRYTDKEERIRKKYGIKIQSVNELQDKTNIIFGLSESSEKIKPNVSNIIIHKWLSDIEGRINKLLYIKNRVKSSYSMISIEASLTEAQIAKSNIVTLLKKDYYQNVLSDMKRSYDEYLLLYAKDLLFRLIVCLKVISKEEVASDITYDMKYLTAILINSVNDENEYQCSEICYLNYLADSGLEKNDYECTYCKTNVKFNEFYYCPVCGKYLR